jgi:hypothetical protein
MPFEEYAAAPGLNGSSLVHLRRSPMHYRYMADNPQPPTDAMRLGTATHRLILEPERVGDFAVWGLLEEEKVRRGKVWDNFQELNKDAAMIVTVAERDAMVGMAVGARKNLPIKKYADTKGRCEVSMFWRDQITGRRYKGRVDKISDGHIISDLKTCVSCQPRMFGAQSYKLGYHIKMAMYWSGYRAITGTEPKMKLLAIEKKPPYESVVYRVTKDVIIQGLEEWQTLERTLDECEKTNHWPAAYEDETDLMLPAWVGQDTETLDEFAMEEEE